MITNMKDRERYIAYVRVSSPKQGRSGLGLEAQKEIILHNVGNGEVLEWFKEVHTGKNLNNLPQLIAAKEKAKETNSILIVAKTDRLRNTQQALDLVDELTPSGVFFCNVGRNADKFMLTVFFAFAEKERLEISIRTKAALAVLKARGVKLGRPKGIYHEHKPQREIMIKIGKLGNRAMIEQSVNDPNNIAAFNVATILRQKGVSYQGITDYLNEHGFFTPKNTQWRVASVWRLIKRYTRYTFDEI